MSRKPRRAVRLLAATALGVAAVAVLGTATTSAREADTVIGVPATTTFLDTGVTLAAGETAVITARGTISYGSQNAACADRPITPSGCAAESICPVQGGCGALIGRLGSGAPFLVGDRKTVTGPGVLWLGINDVKGAFGDNTGAFSVTIVTGGAAPPPPPPSPAVAKVLRVSGSGQAWVRDPKGKLSPLTAGTALSIGDTVVTGDKTTVTLEFTIGGRAGINSSSSVVVVSERSVDDSGTDVPKTLTRMFDVFGLYGNVQAKSQPVEIQTNGGVIGIKG